MVFVCWVWISNCCLEGPFPPWDSSGFSWRAIAIRPIKNCFPGEIISRLLKSFITCEMSEVKFPAVEGGGSLILAWQIRNKRVLVVGGGEVNLPCLIFNLLLISCRLLRGAY